MELIITEKDNAARRIADILADGDVTADREAGVNVYRWGDRRCVGLSGHVVGVDFPEEYEDWRDVEPRELADAPIVKNATKENIVDVLQRYAREADDVVVATDYDREGELIGKEAYELVREVNGDVPIRRVRFSSITENEVTEAFANPDDLDFDLAEAGEARQIVDLIWGAALTRFLSLSARQLGDDFISVGRVQTPTLKLIVDKEREIEAFDPEDYWELFADLSKAETSFEAQYFYRDEDGNEAERVWDEDDAEAAFAALREAGTAVVDSVDRRTRTDDPPAPFNTTQFIRAAGSLGYAAGRAMSVAEDLYTEGYITYPRTDNTVYPDDLDERDLLETFTGHFAFGDDAASLLEADALEPTRGDSETTDHPPIHPTPDVPDRSDLTDDEWEIYELVVRRFFATVADEAVWEHLKVVAEADGRSLKANGKRLLERGYHAVYPYFGTDENYVPDVDVGEELDVADVRMEEKQTQPPRRYGQSRLIEKMEEMGIGTKCLTGDTRVLVRSDTGDVERRPIADVFDDGEVVMADGDTDLAVTEDGPTTISFDETTERFEYREQTLVSERPLEDDERVYRVTTESGSFAATGDHPVYALVDGDVVVKPLVALEGGDELLRVRESTADVAAGDEVVDVTERDYDGPVYDLTIDESAPNFAVEGGVVVHNSTRHNTIEKLYERGYVEGDPPRPTRLAKAVVEAAEEYADLVVSEEMTAELEADMTAIAEGEKTLEEVTEESREVLERIFEDLTESREEIGDLLQQSLKADKRLGPCPECGSDLLVRRSRQGSYFVGCDGYPDCTFTLPLPNDGEPLVLDETCDEHDLHHVKMLAGRSTFVHGCPLCRAEEAEETEDRAIGPCPQCGDEHGGELLVKQLQSGSRLVGCSRYPDCDYSLPLPRRGDIEITDEYCDEHGLPELHVHQEGDDEPWELGCPICNYEEYRERQRERQGLKAIEGIGAKTEKKLTEVGVEDVDDLREADADDVADRVEGVSADRVREWQSRA